MSEAPAATPVPPGPVRPSKPAGEFRYFCRVCCANFTGDAARRHRAHNDRVYRESRRPTARRVL